MPLSQYRPSISIRRIGAAPAKNPTELHSKHQRKALEKVDGKLRPAKSPRWKRDADLLAWLDSL